MQWWLFWWNSLLSAHGLWRANADGGRLRKGRPNRRTTRKGGSAAAEVRQHIQQTTSGRSFTV
jgi:hypothetical protein